MQNDVYFGALRRELNRGGRAAFLDDMLQRKVDWSMTRHPLQTDAKREVAERSLKPIERWWYEKLKTGMLLGRNASDVELEAHGVEADLADWPTTVTKERLHDNYIAFLSRHQPGDRTQRSTETELGGFLKKQLGPLLEEARDMYGAEQRERYWRIPTLDSCRAAWEKCFGWRGSW